VVSGVAVFDLHLNPSARERDGFPYLVVMQSAQLDFLPTRLVMPLQRLSGRPMGLPRRMVQPVVIEGETLYPAPQQCAAVPARVLRQPLRSLADQQGALRDALDAVISGI
jgi:toxin CcdB